MIWLLVSPRVGRGMSSPPTPSRRRDSGGGQERGRFILWLEFHHSTLNRDLECRRKWRSLADRLAVSWSVRFHPGRRRCQEKLGVPPPGSAKWRLPRAGPGGILSPLLKCAVPLQERGSGGEVNTSPAPATDTPSPPPPNSSPRPCAGRLRAGGAGRRRSAAAARRSAARPGGCCAPPGCCGWVHRCADASQGLQRFQSAGTET